MTVSTNYYNRPIVRAVAALAAAGAWSNHDFFCAPYGELKLEFSYLRGAAGGAFDFQVLVSFYTATAEVPAGIGEWASGTLYAPGVLAPGATTQSRMQSEYVTYREEGSGALETMIYGTLDISNMQRMRIRVRESGVIGTPGTLSILAMMA